MLLLFAGLMLPAGEALAYPGHSHGDVAAAAGLANAAVATANAECPDHPVERGQPATDCCTVGCSSTALPAFEGELAALPSGRHDLPVPSDAIPRRDPESLFRPPR